MPKYKVTDPYTGKELFLTGDSPPTKQELEAIFNESALETEQESVGPQGYQPPTYSEIGTGLKKDMGEAWDTLKEGSTAPFADYQSAPPIVGLRSITEGVLPAAGKVAIGAGKAVLSGITPDPIEKVVMDGAYGVLEGAAELLKNDWVAPVLEMAQKGIIGPYSEWREENPVRAKELESVVDLSLIMAPATNVSKLTGGLSDKVGDLSRKAVEAAESKARKLKGATRRERVSSLLEPLDIRAAGGKVDEQGLLRTQTYTPTPDEEEIIDIISGLDNFKVNRTSTYNYNVVNDEIVESSNRLISQIMRKGNPEVDSTRIKEEMHEALENLFDDPTFFGGPDVERNAKKIQKLVYGLMEKSDGTVAGLLQVRKDLDDLLRINKPATFNADFHDAKAKTLRVIREHLNGGVGEVVPDVEVLNQLRRQHMIFRGRDVLDAKADLEDMNSVSRAIASASKISGVNMPKTIPSLLITGGIAGGVMLSGIAPYLGAGAATVVSGYLLKSWIKSGTLHQNLASTLKVINTSIKKADGVALKQLKADRLAIISFMRDYKEEPLEAERKQEGSDASVPYMIRRASNG